jgi:CRISPR/Cas system CSM-associated protein Csm3 (group 7 of RAMP superfamily)
MRTYRTLVCGKLVQQSALSAGGTGGGVGEADMACARDGAGRLTLTGAGLAGALVETAGRIFPDLLSDGDDWWRAISAKGTLRKDAPAGRDEAGLRQSLWHFWPAHLEEVETERRQGVGIRQATGAAAAEGRALFDAETIPAGANWDLLFEIDTRRGGDKVEALALLALWEWVQGRCWLGAGAARGMGWMTLEDVHVLRLPLTRDSIDAWPNATLAREEYWPALQKVGVPVYTDLRDEALRLWPRMLGPGRFHYATYDVSIEAGMNGRDGEYGLDSLAVGGHAEGHLEPLMVQARPLGVRPEKFEYVPDSPVVTSAERPFLPGGGLRGPMRHAASRWWNSRGHTAADPNEATPNQGRAEKPTEADKVGQAFGLVKQSARLLVRDGRLDEEGFHLACLQHHAEDEFTAGVFGSGKFDRTALLEGTIGTQLVIEAETAAELEAYLETLRPILALARLGFIPLGGGKWRGHGWVKWKVGEVTRTRAGGE